MSRQLRATCSCGFSASWPNSFKTVWVAEEHREDCDGEMDYEVIQT